MKTKIILFAILLLIIGGLMACEDRLDNPAVITKYIDASVVSVGGTIIPLGVSEVISGKDFTVTFKPDVGYDIDIVKIDGVVSVLTDNLSYTFINVASNHKIEVTYKKNRQGILMQYPLGWETVSCYQRDVGTTEWKTFGTYIYTYIFSETRANVFLDGKLIGDGLYFVKGDSLIFGSKPLGSGGIRTKINVLTEDYLEFSAISKYYQGPGDPILPDSEYRYIYKPKK